MVNKKVNKPKHPWNALNPALRRKFGARTYRAALDIGFSCPNRDGTVATGGCLFCDAGGSRATYIETDTTIAEQIKKGIEIARQPDPDTRVIAYFQAFSGTHGPLDILQNACNTVLAEDKVVAIAIATRPDCLPEATLDYLSTLNEKTFLWVEMGLQTSNDATLHTMRRGHDVETFIKSAEKLKQRNIRLVGHVLAGLPGDCADDTLRCANILNQLDAWGVKLHNLYIDKQSPLAGLWQEGKVDLLDEVEYRNIAKEFLVRLAPDILIHRLVGHAPSKRLLAPDWCLDKQKFLRSLEETMRSENRSQGDAVKLSS
jgi:uncharacterized protein